MLIGALLGCLGTGVALFMTPCMALPCGCLGPFFPLPVFPVPCSLLGGLVGGTVGFVEVLATGLCAACEGLYTCLGGLSAVCGGVTGGLTQICGELISFL